MQIFILIYITSLFIIEYIGFYIFQIKLNSNYPSLLGIGILHGSIEMKAFYLGAGPVYIMVTGYLFGEKKE